MTLCIDDNTIAVFVVFSYFFWRRTLFREEKTMQQTLRRSDTLRFFNAGCQILNGMLSLLGHLPVSVLFVSFWLITTGSPAMAANSCQYPIQSIGTDCSGITWPTTEWRPISIASAGKKSGGNSPWIDFVGSSTYPGMYACIKGSYLFIRVRVGFTGTVAAGTYHDSLLVMFKTDGNDITKYPNYGFAWDSKSNNNNSHGLEMQIRPTNLNPTKWRDIDMDDLDGNTGQKIVPPDINTSGDGYVRTVDGVSTPSAGWGDNNSTFVDFAVSCTYLTNTQKGSWGSSIFPVCSGLSNYRVQVGSISDATDHNKIDYDVGRGVGLDDNITLGGWGSPTMAVVSDLQAYQAEGQVVVSWTTASEFHTAGYNLYRLEPVTGKRSKVNVALVPALIESPQGGKYLVTDANSWPGETLTYLLEEVEFGGRARDHGPYTVVADTLLTGINRAGATFGDRGYTRLPQLTAAAPVAGSTEKTIASIKPTPASKVKIGVQRSGLYRVEASQIATAMGLSPDAIVKLIRANGLQIRTGAKRWRFFRQRMPARSSSMARALTAFTPIQTFTGSAGVPPT
jgi:hypothetical protein